VCACHAAPYDYRDLVPAYRHAGQLRVEVVEPNAPIFRAAAGMWLDRLDDHARLLGAPGRFARAEQLVPDRMTAAWRTFESRAHRIAGPAAIYLVPAPAAAIGGAMRPLGSTTALILGIEEVATALATPHGFDVLVLHELTHV
jgi:hypothetical protein